MANRTLEFVLQTKKQGDAVTELTEEHKKLADTLRNKVSLAMSESEQAARKLAAAQEKLTASSDPEEQAKLGHEVNKARVAMDNAQAKADKYSDELNGLYDNSKKAGDSQQGLGLSLTELRSGYELAVEGAEILAQAYDALIAKSAEWGDSMGDLAQVTGQSVEDTSQMAATLELLGVSTDKFTGIIKAMTKEGLQLNMETLVRLSKEYQAIKDPIKQNEFLFKNFGRAAEDMAEVMGKSTDELIQMGNAAKYSGKVIGEEAANQAERLNIQMAILQQKVEGAGIALGNVLIPWLNGAIDGAYNLVKAQQALVIQFQLSTGQIDQQTAATKAAALANGDLFAAWHEVTAEAETGTEATSSYNAELANSAAAARWAGIAEAELARQREANNAATENAKNVYGDALTALREFNIGEAQRLALEQAIKLASGELTQEDVARAEAIGFLTKQLELGNITQAQYIEKLNALATGAATAREAILSIPANHDVNINYRFNVSGQPPNPAAGDINLPGGSEGTYNPTPGQEITPIGGAYATGGQFTVPGAGSGDRPYLVNLTPGETVNVTPRGQAPSGGGVTVNIMPGAIVLQGGGGDTRGVADALLQQLGAAVRQAVQGGHAYVGAT